MVLIKYSSELAIIVCVKLKITSAVAILVLTCSRSRSSASFMFLVWIRRISSLHTASGIKYFPFNTKYFYLPTASGMPMSTSRSNLPNLRSAGSMELGLLVAAITITCDLGTL